MLAVSNMLMLLGSKMNGSAELMSYMLAISDEHRLFIESSTKRLERAGKMQIDKHLCIYTYIPIFQTHDSIVAPLKKKHSSSCL